MKAGLSGGELITPEQFGMEATYSGIGLKVPFTGKKCPKNAVILKGSMKTIRT